MCIACFNRICCPADTNHTFTHNETDWGFTQFVKQDLIHNPEEGFLDSNGALSIEVSIQIQRDERYSYDSKKETGCVGLKNQGATCYMNSLLQFLYNVPLFRKVRRAQPVFKHPFE